MNNIADLEKRIADINARRLAWKWTPTNPLSALEAEIFQVLDEAIRIYPDATTSQREYIRQMLAKYYGVGQYLKSYVTGSITKLDTTVSSDRLYPALIAISIDNNNFGDYRDVLVMLGNLWLTAARAGIDPKPYFDEVAAISSSDLHSQGNKSTRDILTTFDQSAHFQEAVKPHLP
jgi:hypothetical protein